MSNANPMAAIAQMSHCTLVSRRSQPAGLSAWSKDQGSRY